MLSVQLTISFRDKQRLHGQTQNHQASLFFSSTSLSRNQSDVIFKALKNHINDYATEKNIKNEFQYKLMMSASDPGTFLNILAGWRSSVLEQDKKELDEFIHSFYAFYPEIYNEINAQQPIPKPA